MAESDPRGAAAKAAGDVTLVKVKIDAQPDLHVDPPKKPGGAYAVVAERIQFSAVVKIAETAAKGDWNVGWIQTIFPCHQSVTYRDPAGTAQGTMTSSVTRALADGVSQEDTGHFAWSEPVPEVCQAGQSVEVLADDEPNVPFREPYLGKAPEWIQGWKAVATSGSMRFGTWLIAEAPNREIEYLYHVVWDVDFGTSLKDGAIVAATGKLSVTSQGAGKGACEPCFSPEVADPGEHPFLPDQDLQAAKPTGQ